MTSTDILVNNSSEFNTTEYGYGNSTVHPHKSLYDLNWDEVMKRLGGIIFVGLLAIIGIIGNIHVLYIYGTKFKKTNQRIFILFLAGLDLFTSSVGMPFIVSDLLLPLKFNSSVACKLLRCTNYFTGGSSAFVLVVIAVERYRKICRPMRIQMSNKQAKISATLALALSLLLSWPAAILYGKSTVYTDVPGVIGAACYIEDKFITTKYTSYYNIIITIIIIIANIILIVLYIKIGQQIRRQKKFKQNLNSTTADKKRKPSFLPGQVTKVANSEFSFTGSMGSDLNIPKSSDDDVSVSAAMIIDSDGKKTKRKFKRASKKAVKVTFMLFMITVVYTVSFLPHLMLKILADVKKDFLESLNFAGSFTYYLLLYTIFINNVANPIIYGFCDSKFLERIKTMYRRPCVNDT